MLKIKCNDEVIVICGKDKGKRGKVKSFCSSLFVIVNGINIVKKHQKSNPDLGKSSSILELEASIHISNIAIYNPSSCKADRVGFRFENGKKVRFFKSNMILIDL